MFPVWLKDDGRFSARPVDAFLYEIGPKSLLLWWQDSPDEEFALSTETVAAEVVIGLWSLERDGLAYLHSAPWHATELSTPTPVASVKNAMGAATPLDALPQQAPWGLEPVLRALPIERPVER